MTPKHCGCFIITDLTGSYVDHRNCLHEQQLKQIAALTERCRGLEDKRPLHMYVWSVEGSWFAVAQARSVDEARRLILPQCGGGDGSCPARERALRHIQNNAPSIWHGQNAEFALTDSAELEERTVFLEKEQKRIQAQEKRITELEAEIQRIRFIFEDEAAVTVNILRQWTEEQRHRLGQHLLGDSYAAKDKELKRLRSDLEHIAKLCRNSADYHKCALCAGHAEIADAALKEPK